MCGKKSPITLEYRINLQVLINAQVGYFLQNNKHTGPNKHIGEIISISVKYVLTFATIKSTHQQFYGKLLRFPLFDLDLGENLKN